jgi:hypothetical protein
MNEVDVKTQKQKGEAAGDECTKIYFVVDFDCGLFRLFGFQIEQFKSL